MHVRQPYSQDDFDRNPGKFAHFKTATIAETIRSRPRLCAGRVVRIRYHATQVNRMRGNVAMPIYRVWLDDDEDLKAAPAMIYACALGDFVL